ncbi:hypothetical protein [Bosea sp. (in: a-proteobacteria)]|uniref:hypothetical protein n=1 Tax=Bosea sp. (in: a-proteobacteria) TaxID=1871050 RepID=UPI002FC8E42A
MGDWMLVEKRKPRLHAASGVVLAALISCAMLVLLSLASAKAAEARTGRQAWASTGETALGTMERSDLIANHADDNDCHNGAAASECCTGYCPFAIISLPADPAPPSAKQPLPEAAFAGDYQTDAIRPDKPPRSRPFAHLHEAERA